MYTNLSVYLHPRLRSNHYSYAIYNITFQKKRMPDGHNYIEANQIIYKNVTRKHSGTYICEGSNGPGQIVSDEIQVDILRK